MVENLALGSAHPAIEVTEEAHGLQLDPLEKEMEVNEVIAEVENLSAEIFQVRVENYLL